MLLRFLSAVLPATGVYVTAWLQAGKVKQRAVQNLAAVHDYCLRNSNTATDCWFALAAYKQGWHEVPTAEGTRNKLRTHDNARAAKALWLDLDVGDDKPYTTREEALQGLVQFCKTTGMLRPWVVSSGAKGVHVYWAFAEEVSPQDWQHAADRLHAACVKHELHADPMRTRDISSIMRAPFTWNCKGVPTQVQIMLEGATTPYADVSALLAGYTPLVKGYSPKAVHYDLSGAPVLPAAPPADVMRLFQPIKQEYPERDAVDIVAGCRQIREMDSGKEPSWRAALSVLRFATRGIEAARILSKREKWRTEYNLDEKLGWLEANDIKPMSCETFRQYRPEMCEGCPFAGVINSPISVPRRQQAVPAAPQDTPPATGDHGQPAAGDEPEDGEAPAQEGGELSSPPAPPPPTPPAIPDTVPEFSTKNSRVNEKGCWVRTKTAEGEWVWTHIYDHPVYPVQRIKDTNNAGELQVSYIFRKHRPGGYDDIQIMGETLLGQGLNAYLGSVGFVLHDKEKKLMAAMLIDLLKETEASLNETRLAHNLGWDNTQSSFLLGNKLYKTDGTVVAVTPRGAASDYSNLTVPRGELETWKQIANVYNRPGMEWGQAAVASAFASPLMPIGALEQAALLFLTGDKGAGKSTALALAVSVYGNPSRMMINKDDTYLARIAKLGIMNNIAAAFDEMTDLRPKEASELAYQITQGRGKDRMNSGGEGLMYNTTYWSCLPVMSANDSIINALSQQGDNPTAQMSRVLEIRATNANTIMTQEEFAVAERLVRKLPQNYGTAGDAYIRYVTAHRDEIEELIIKTEQLFLKHSGLNSTYRFWTYMCTRMLVGISIARKLGLVQYDLSRLFLYFVAAVKKARESVDRYEAKESNLFPAFLAEQLPNRLVVTALRRPSGMPDNADKGEANDLAYVVSKPSGGREITVRMELEQQQVCVSIPFLRKWCRREGYGYADFVDAIKRDFGKVRENVRRDLGAHTTYRSNTRVECLIVKLPKDMLDDAKEQMAEADE